MRYAIIENGTVVNVAAADEPLFDNWLEAPDGVAIGWLYDGEFSAPVVETPVPASVTPRQARLALLGAGLLATATAALDALPESTKTAALIEWEYASEIRRDSALVAAIGAALGLTSEQIDDLFRTAATL